MAPRSVRQISLLRVIQIQAKSLASVDGDIEEMHHSESVHLKWLVIL